MANNTIRMLISALLYGVERSLQTLEDYVRKSNTLQDKNYGQVLDATHYFESELGWLLQFGYDRNRVKEFARKYNELRKQCKEIYLREIGVSS